MTSIENNSDLGLGADPVFADSPGENIREVGGGACRVEKKFGTEGLTPVMQQFMAAKAQYPDALLFFRMGDFYELFYDDARVASRELQITLTARDRERSIPMCGVPYHAAEGYLQRLLRKGFRIAICEQMEDPKLTKKIVRREVTRLLTPGTAIDASLGGDQNNFLAATREEGGVFGLALLDLSTGDFRAFEFTGASAMQRCAEELLKAAPSEILLAASDTRELLEGNEGGGGMPAAETRVDDWVWSYDYAVPLLERKLGVRTLSGFGLEGHRLAAAVAGVILHYVEATQKLDALHLDSLRFVEHSDQLQLDPVSVRNLELVEPLFSSGDSRFTLFHTLDSNLTPMGKRMLRATILRPLMDVGRIKARYEAVAELHRDLLLREAMRKSLTSIFDLERLLAKLSLDSAGPRDLVALASSLGRLPGVATALAALKASRWTELAAGFDGLEDVCGLIQKTLVAEPPLTLADGGAIAAGVSSELDELKAVSRDGRQSIAAIEERERMRTGIGSLKVRYNSVFGYYIEISKSNLAHAPADYERKQTLVNAERFTTRELKDFEMKILTAQDRSIEIEKQILISLRQRVLEAAGRIRRSSAVVAESDMLASFAHLASVRNYVRPELVEEPVLEAVAARHPMIENWMNETGSGRFIPNSLYLRGHLEMAQSDGAVEPSLLLITGPNMGGKSTYLRQAAVLVLMAQMGSYVPAAQMRYGLVDRIYTRIGASDNVARGRSTFMVEMIETATILNTATARSLVLLDEMGRGTATFDGLSLAWAVVEYVHATVGARTIFATHYHELTLLAEKLERAINLRVAVKESQSGITFLHSIEPGAANKSYGIEVAKLAGLPRDVLDRARHILRQHEKQERRSLQAETAEPMQMTMFTPLSQRIVDRLSETDINALTPLQALNLLGELKQELERAATVTGVPH